MIPNISKPLQKKGSIIGNYILQDKPIKRQLSSSSQSDQEEDGTLKSPKRRQPAPNTKRCCDNDEHTGNMQARTTGPQRVFKIVFLGNSGVGKSSFIQHYCTGQLSNTMIPTVGLDFQMRSVTLGSTTMVLQLWDTAGQERSHASRHTSDISYGILRRPVFEPPPPTPPPPLLSFRFRSITQQYYRKADGILVMYDVVQVASFTAARGWLDEVEEKKSEGAVVMLLGNKIDMADGQKRAVTSREGRRLAEQYQAVFYECSAKSGYNIEELMLQLAGLLAAQQDRQCEDTLLLEDPSTSKPAC